jgi:DNA adenine methylase
MESLDTRNFVQNALAGNGTCSPFLKWAGGKTQLLEQLSKHVPPKFGKYIEPFLGGGAFFFYLQPRQSILSDSNEELINCFQVVQSHVNELIRILKTYKNTETFYYKVREQDPNKLSLMQRAARLIFLNRTCFNGLYRVNKEGRFNVPYGNYKNPNICDDSRLLKAHQALQGAKIICSDYKHVLTEFAEAGDFIYFDPPYYPVSEYSDFKRYTKEFFYEEDHVELAAEFRRLAEKGSYVLLTNSNCEFVRQLYNDFSYTIVDTLRIINKDASKRNNGEDIIVSFTEPQKKTRKQPGLQTSLSPLLKNFPGTKFMGSKYSVLSFIWDSVRHLEFESVLDLFSGSSCVSYKFKQHGKKVISNDFLRFCYHFATALIENNGTILTPSDLDLLLSANKSTDGFISKTFKGLYFTDEENSFLDSIRANIDSLESRIKKSLALSALSRACLKRRPRGIFTYIGDRYNDGRKDLQIDLKEHFIQNVNAFNRAVFSNHQKNKAYNTDSVCLDVDADLVYIDPPYYSVHSDNDYTRRYHFIEGLCRKWEGLEIQWNSKTKKFRRYETPFSSPDTINEAFLKIFDRHRNSILVVSYSSNSIPGKNELASMLKSFKKRVDVCQINHKYSFGNQGYKVGDNANDVLEYVFVGH